MNIQLPCINYSYEALEPFFDKETMKIHHTKHHQTYVNNVNSILQDLPELKNCSIYEIIKKIQVLPTNKQLIKLQNNLGGHINHSFFWNILKVGVTLKEGQLKKTICNNFGNIENFKKEFENISMNIFGSGWAWVIKKNQILSIVSTINQDNPIMKEKNKHIYGYPILGLDLWEHAYYLKYQNRRLDYIKSFWNVINWDIIEYYYNNNNTK